MYSISVKVLTDGITLSVHIHVLRLHFAYMRQDPFEIIIAREIGNL